MVMYHGSVTSVDGRRDNPNIHILTSVGSKDSGEEIQDPVEAELVEEEEVVIKITEGNKKKKMSDQVLMKE